MISYDEFSKLDLRIARIESAESIDGADKLLKLSVNLGSETRTLAAGIAGHYEPQSLIGRQIVMLANLEPKMLCGVESQGMLLAADVKGKPFLLQPDAEVPEGAEVR